MKRLALVAAIAFGAVAAAPAAHSGSETTAFGADPHDGGTGPRFTGYICGYATPTAPHPAPRLGRVYGALTEWVGRITARLLTVVDAVDSAVDTGTPATGSVRRAYSPTTGLSRVVSKGRPTVCDDTGRGSWVAAPRRALAIC